MKYNVILFLVMLVTSHVLHAQSEGYSYEDNAERLYFRINPGEVAQKKGYDAEQIQVRKFDSKKWQDIVGDIDYSETEPTWKKKEESMGSESSTNGKRLKQSRKNDESEESETSSSPAKPFTSPIFNIIVYALIIGLIAYILFLIIRNTSLGSKGKIAKSDLQDHTAVVEDIKELEIDKLLREAITSGNYRLAIRIYFLGLLKKLDEDGFIVWKKNKTNRDYLSELFSKARYYDEVKTLTFVYEQVWYGDHNLPVKVYEQIISSFKAIDQKLNDSKRS